MGRPTKKQQKLKQKAAEAAKKAEEFRIQQEELARKAEERTRKKAEEIASKNQQLQETSKTSETTSDVVENKPIENISSMSVENKNQIQSNNEVVDESKSDTVGNETIGNIEETINEELDIPEEIKKELLDGENPSEFEINEDAGFDPLEEKVIKRSYTEGKINNPVTNAEPQTTDTGAGTGSGSGNETKDTHVTGQTQDAQPKIEPEISEPEIKEIPPEITAAEEEKKKQEQEKEKPKSEPVNPKLDDLSPTQKRKAAEKTADALITTYSNLVPIPFIKISSFNERKLEARHLNDEIDMNMQIMDDGTRVVDYCQKVNRDAESTFVVTKEMKEEIREPLIDVLLENNFALTPTQRLIMAVGGQILQMGITAIQYMQQNSNAMETFKKFHEDNKAYKKQQQSGGNNNSGDGGVNINTNPPVNNPPVNNSSEDNITTNNSSNDEDIPLDNNKITVEEFLNQ